MIYDDQNISLDDLFDDLDHPNPNINNQAYEKMARFWPEQSIQRLIKNLDSKNINLRRKSVKGIAYFGVDIVNKIINLYCSSNNEILKISCLKILTIVCFNYDLNHYHEELNSLIKSALEEDSPEMILLAISLLRQIGEKSLPLLKQLCKDINILKAKAAITALVEINHVSLQSFLLELSQDDQIDDFIRDNAKEALRV